MSILKALEKVNVFEKALSRNASDISQEQSSDDDEPQSALSPTTPSIYRESQKGGEHLVSARVGSTESLDQTSEDFNRSSASRATGFHGKNSEVTWVQRLTRQANNGSDDSDEYLQEQAIEDQSSPISQTHHLASGLATISDSSYHCDDLTVIITDRIDPFEMPPQATGNTLFQTYMDTVHPSFPIVGKNNFTAQYQTYVSGDYQMKVGHDWLAILNLIFAIGAKHSHLIKAEWRGDPKDHLIYFTRARMLGFNADSILGHAGLQRVQVAGLITFYLMAINQINRCIIFFTFSHLKLPLLTLPRAWAISGIAIRHALTLGLNLRNESNDVSEPSKEIRYRVWWALCSVERLLAVMTGRPSSFTETDCTAPLPLPIEEDSFYGNDDMSPQTIRMLRRLSSQDSRATDVLVSTPSSSSQSSRARGSPAQSANQSIASLPPTIQQSPQKPAIAPCNALAFAFHAKLSTLTSEVLDRLYRADAMEESWAHIQSIISNLDSKLEKWRAELPVLFDFTKKQRDQHFVSQRLSLGFFYYSTLMIINRPCLCRIDRKIPNESGIAKNFNRETAAKCVHAAQGMLGLLPDEPNAVGLYKVAPWWCLVHYFMQSATILMLEISFRADHMPIEVEEVFESAKKTLEWLRSMSEDDEAARRASVLCNELLRKVAPKVGRSAYDASSFQPGGAYDIQSVDDMQQTQVSQPEQAHHSDHYNFATSAPFQHPTFSTYDQFLSYDKLPSTSAPAPFDDIFPTSHDMEGMSFNDPGYFHGRDPQWYPRGGA